jgi:lipid-A-disaccharide synthase
MSDGKPLVFLVAGEPSGDVLGASLMAALRQASGDGVRFAGVGGERMEAEGLRSLFTLEDIAVMGITEILPRLPVIFDRLRRTKSAIREQKPAVVVTIDAPAFCIRIAEASKKLGIPVVHYVGPQYWAWRPWRVNRFARAIDHLMVLLPFEPAFFEKAGMACTYVGHPATQEGGAIEGRAAFRQRHSGNGAGAGGAAGQPARPRRAHAADLWRDDRKAASGTAGLASAAAGGGGHGGDGATCGGDLERSIDGLEHACRQARRGGGR